MLTRYMNEDVYKNYRCLLSHQDFERLNTMVDIVFVENLSKYYLDNKC